MIRSMKVSTAHAASRRPASYVVAAASGQVGRETEEIYLQFANLTARVAAAARRIVHGQPLDPHRDTRMLLSAENLLTTGADALENGGSQIQSHVRQTSYAFAKLTHSVLSSEPARMNSHDHDERESTARELRELADQVKAIRTGSLDGEDASETAREIMIVFGQLSSVVLRDLGTPGDSIGGARTGLRS